jgi:hypothetical protein
MNLAVGQLVQLVQLVQREQQLLVLRRLEQQVLQLVVVWVQQPALQLRLRHR